MEDIPDDLIMNWDHTAVSIVPGSQWTMAQKGAKRIEMISLDDKRQIQYSPDATSHSMASAREQPLEVV